MPLAKTRWFDSLTGMVVKQEINPEVWVDEYGDALFGFAMARVKDKATAEDIVQETFLAAMQALKGFNGCIL